MTRKNNTRRSPRPRQGGKSLPGRWILEDAKARFSEVVRLAHSEGPQRVTVHGRDEVVVISADEYHRLKGDRSGRLLVELVRNSPLRDLTIEPCRSDRPSGG